MDRETYRREWKAYLSVDEVTNGDETMRSRLDDLTIAKFVTFEECCSACFVLYRFEEARVTRQGRFLHIMLLCPECGHRKKVALHSWYHKRGLMKKFTNGRTMTVGEKIDAQVKEYIDLYERFRKDKKYRDKAHNLATYDLIMQKYVAEKVLERVQAYIESRETDLTTG